MIQLIAENSPIIGTIGFVLGFVYVVYSVFCKTSKKDHEDHSKIPLKDEEG